MHADIWFIMHLIQSTMTTRVLPTQSSTIKVPCEHVNFNLTWVVPDKGPLNGCVCLMTDWCNYLYMD